MLVLWNINRPGEEPLLGTVVQAYALRVSQLRQEQGPEVEAMKEVKNQPGLQGCCLKKIKPDQIKHSSVGHKNPEVHMAKTKIRARGFSTAA